MALRIGASGSQLPISAFSDGLRIVGRNWDGIGRPLTSRNRAEWRSAIQGVSTCVQYREAAGPGGGRGQVRGAYSIEWNGQSRSSQASTASCRTGSSAARSTRTQDLTDACGGFSALPPGSWPWGG